MTLASLIQAMTDQRIPLNTTTHHRWHPFWHTCYVRQINGNWVISNRPY